MPDSGIADGSTFTSAFWDTYVRQQVVVQCTSGARPTGVEGRVIYETDTDRMYVYSGTTWCSLAKPTGALIAYTPTLTQGATPTFTTNRATYSRTGRRIQGDGYVTITATPGTAATNVLFGLPVAPATTSGLTIMGQAFISDVSAGFVYFGDLMFNSGSLCSILRRVDGAAFSYLGTSSFTAALAVDDVVSYRFDYEAAADG